MDTAAIEEMQAQLDLVDTLPECLLTDEELGTETLHSVMPDTWKNISWVIQNATELLLNRSVADAQMIERIKNYGIEANRTHCNTFMKSYEKGNAD